MTNDLFGQLEKIIKSKQKVNQTTTGLLRPRDRRPLDSMVDRIAVVEKETERLHELTAKIKAKDVWRNHSLWIYVLTTHCTCGRSYSAPQGLLLRQQHKDNGSARYNFVPSLEGLSGLSLSQLHRQERIPCCPTCMAERIITTVHDNLNKQQSLAL